MSIATFDIDVVLGNLIVAILCTLKWLSWSDLTYIAFIVLSACIVFLLAPVEDHNKPLDELEQRVYKNGPASSYFYFQS